MQRYLAIVNPAAGGGRAGERAPGLIERLQNLGVHVDVRYTDAAGQATQIAAEGLRDGHRNLISIGGDGTAFEIVNGMSKAFGAGAEGVRPSLALLPLGTGNSLLRDFTSDGIERVIDAISLGRRRPMDVVRLVHDKGALYFVNLMSVGFTADVCALANRRFKRFGAAGYGLGVFAELAALRSCAVDMTMDGGVPWKYPTTFVAFCNSKYTGGEMMMAPYADTSDGEMDVIAARAMGRATLVRLFARIFNGTHVHHHLITASRARRVDLDFAAPVDLMIDGEVLRLRPLRVEVVPSAVDLVV